jgi:hypothetical protein
VAIAERRLKILQGLVVALLAGNIAYYGGYYYFTLAEIACFIAAAVAAWGGDKFLTPLLQRVLELFSRVFGKAQRAGVRLRGGGVSRIGRASIEIARRELNRRRRKARTAMRLFLKHIELLRQNARNRGYALAVHGSLVRDIDILAVPWTPEAESARHLKEGLVSLLKALQGGKGVYASRRATRKPHGRVAYVIHLGGTYIDLSVMPRRT